MCGRYVLKTLPERIIEAIADILIPLSAYSARYNIAPSQQIPVVHEDSDHHRRLTLMGWGLIPAWARDASIANKLINARAETLTQKPAFRRAFAKRRCLIPADGFYEWQRAGKRKQPVYIHRRDDAPFFFAGLWERWTPPATEDAIQTVTIVTTRPNRLLTPIHDRMPVIVQPADYSAWLDAETPSSRLTGIFDPYPDADLDAYPVSTRVNDVSYDAPDCTAPASAPLAPAQFSPGLFDSAN